MTARADNVNKADKCVGDDTEASDELLVLTKSGEASKLYS
jgi:hypothetical protein